MGRYKVSIIVPVYNVEPYIEACLQSVANQSMAEGVECILVDDCGTDQSMQVVENFVQKYKGPIAFTILHHDYNKGLSAARNTGIRAVQGDYIYFLDSDDEITPGCIETLWNIVDAHVGIDMVQSSYVSNDSPYMRQFLQKAFPEYTGDRKLIKRSLLDYDTIPVMAQNRLVRRDIIMKNEIFFKEGIIHEDNHWGFFLAKYVSTMAFCRYQTYVYKTTPGSITNNINREKEIYSYQTILRDFCANIDSHQRGAQRYCIFLLLDTLLRLKYYHSIEEKNELWQLFTSVCTPVERIILKQWYQTPLVSEKHKKLSKVLLKIFRR